MDFPFGNKEEKQFDENLEQLEKITYKTGAFRGGNETRTYTISGDKIKRVIEYSYGREKIEPEESFPYTKEAFIEGLRGFKIGKWKKNYNDPLALDGWYWDLSFEYSGEKNSVRFYGSNAYPRNYKEFKEFMRSGEKNK